MRKGKTKSSINRARLGYAIATTGWDSEDEDESPLGAEQTLPTPLGEETESYTYMSVAHTGKVTTHKESRQVSKSRADQSSHVTGCFDTATSFDSLLPEDTSLNVSSPSSSHAASKDGTSPPLNGGAPRSQSLLDYEFAIATYDEHGILEGEPTKPSTPEEIAAARRASRKTPGQVSPSPYALGSHLILSFLT